MAVLLLIELGALPPLGPLEVVIVLLLMEVGALPLEFGAGPVVVRVGRTDGDVVLLQGTVTVVYEYVTVVNGIEIEAGELLAEAVEVALAEVD
jgi:hypothetical protein